MNDSASSSTPTLEQSLGLIRDHFKKGDYLKAYDVSNRALESGQNDPELVYFGILSLARCGATQEAIKTFNRYESQVPRSEDMSSLAARLKKDEFRTARDPAEKLKLGLLARNAYLLVFKETGGYFPAINAATLSLLIGEEAESLALARRVLEICQSHGEADYWVQVTRAEAQLLIGNLDEMESALKKAMALRRDDFASQGTCYRQLALICEYRGIDPDKINDIRPPAIIHYTGHMLDGIGKSPGIRQEDQELIRFKVAQILEQERVGFAFGSLACGGDLIVAEEILKRGAVLHAFLPFRREDFLKTSVIVAGEEWTKRYEAVLAKATSVFEVVNDAWCSHELLYEVCARQSMGSAVLKSRTLGSKVFQVALWNGRPPSGPAGTGADVGAWKEMGFSSVIIPVPVDSGLLPEPITRSPITTGLRRELRSMIFADVHGYSRLTEGEAAVFMAEWFKRLEAIIAKHRDEIVFANTWGDAVFLVVKTTSGAARVSLELAERLSSTTWHELGLRSVQGVRVSAHAGPVFAISDPVLGRENFFGMHVNKAARIEPCTPVGNVYVSEESAALLTFENRSDYVCEYAGEQPLPKDFGVFRMYHLSRA